MRCRYSVALAATIFFMAPDLTARSDAQEETNQVVTQEAAAADASQPDPPAGKGEPDEAETEEPEGSPRQLLKRMFDESSPPLGSPLPDITAFDSDGNELNLGSLKGHWSVIVFGCLT